MDSITNFIKNHVPLCCATFGMAILGYMGYRAVCWIKDKCGKTQKIDTIAKNHLSVPKPPVKPPISPSKITSPVVTPPLPPIPIKPLIQTPSPSVPPKTIPLTPPTTSANDLFSPEKKALMTLITDQLEKGNDNQKKKAALFKLALDRYEKAKCVWNLKTYRLASAEKAKYEINKSIPAYLKNTRFFPNSSSTISSKPEYYDYKESMSQSPDYWVDFANASLGGGCFKHGFVQEEIMVTEMPDFVAHIAANESSIGNIPTREGNQTIGGSPNPYLLTGLHRVQVVPANAYGRGINNLSLEELLNETQPVISGPLNVLAIAAPYLPKRNAQVQFDVHTLADIFNTLMAGFALTKNTAIGPLTIHSGKLGCGAFNNDIVAVYLLHRLAALQTEGVALVLHGYTKEENEQCEDIWYKIQPKLVGLPLAKCLEVISQELNK